MLFWRPSKSNSKYIFEWLIVPSLRFVFFGSVKMIFEKFLLTKENRMMLEIVDKNVSKITTLLNNLADIFMF